MSRKFGAAERMRLINRLFTSRQRAEIAAASRKRLINRLEEIQAQLVGMLEEISKETGHFECETAQIEGIEGREKLQ